MGPDGTVSTINTSGSPAAPDPPPRVPTPQQLQRTGIPFTLTAEGGGLEYRAVTARSGSDVIVVAAPLKGVDSTVDNLADSLLIVSVITVGALALLIWAVIATGNRQLDHLVETAADIGAGDLGARVDEFPRAPPPASSAGPSTRWSPTSSPPSPSAPTPRTACAGSPPTPRTSCAPPSPTSAATPSSCAPAATTPSCTAAPCSASRARRRAWPASSTTSCSSRGSTNDDPSRRRPSTSPPSPDDAVDDAHRIDPTRPLTADIPDHPVTVAGDEARLRQVFANLLGNIRVHTDPTDAAHVEVADGPDEVVVTVSDEGPGMRPETVEQIFDRFYRPETSRSRAKGGTGLGLAITHEVVVAHGGTIAVDSAPGRGTRFTIRLPVG